MLKRGVLFTLIFVVLCLSFESPICAQGRSVGKVVRLNGPLKRELDTFFSNFSAVGLQPFENKPISDGALISFAVKQIIGHNDKLFERLPFQTTEDIKPLPASGIAPAVSTPCIRLASRHVEATIEEYFGLNFQRHQPVPNEEITYQDGYYFSAGTGCAFGDSIFSFSRITKLLGIGGDNYIANVNVYAATEPAGDVGPYYSVETLRKAGSKVDLIFRIEATIHQVTSPSGARYVLTNYQKSGQSVP